MSEAELFEIDGSVLEGGGQILRNAISLSGILGIPIRVTKIRAGRKKPGLAAQHLKGIQLVAQMCKAQLNGAKIGSTEIEFRPGRITGGQFEADTKTAGSISLLLQVALPCALLATGPVTLTLKGGTNADMAPQIDYMTEVFYQVLKKFGGDFQFNILRRGYFPKGGGHVKVFTNPVRQFNSVDITDRGNVIAIQGWSFVAGTLPIKMAYQMADGAKKSLCEEGEVNIECYKEDYHFAPDNCAGIILTSTTSTGCTLGSDGLGKRGVESHSVGEEAGLRLKKDLVSGTCLDTHAQDQVIIYMALSTGKSVVRVSEVTLHTQTAIHIAELVVKVKFNIQADGETSLIECTGIGYKNDSENLQ